MAEDLGYDDSYFPEEPNRADQGDNYHNNQGEYILAHSPPTSPRDEMSELDPDGSPRDMDRDRDEQDRERQQQGQERRDQEGERERDGNRDRDRDQESERSPETGLENLSEAEREQLIEEVHERLEEADGLTPSTITDADIPNGILGLLPGEEDEPFLAEADRDAKLIEVGTHMSPDHPGYLEHIPSQALSPAELHPDPRDVPHIHVHSHDRAHPMASVPEPQQSGHSTNNGGSGGESGGSRKYPTHPHEGMMKRRRRKSSSHVNQVAEAVFFSYGVSVFFGFQEREEKEIMEDCEKAGTWIRPQKEDDWEVEECHYLVSGSSADWVRQIYQHCGSWLTQCSMMPIPSIPEFITTCSVSAPTPSPTPTPEVNRLHALPIHILIPAFKSHSHLFKLSLAHAVAQSTKLSIYEAIMQESLSLTSEFPKELSITGHLELSRRDALKMTGRLFKLRMDVNLIGGILGECR
jgi:uncharacterized Rmd1/YagE family protein